MILKSSDGRIEINVKVFSNKMIYGSPIGECRKRLTKKTVLDDKNQNKTEEIKKKKDPEDNLGAVIATIDTDKIERGVDFISIDNELKSIFIKLGIGYSEFFNDTDRVARVCERHDLTLKEFVSIMMEHKPEVFNIQFLKNVVRPMVVKVQEDKKYYESKEGEQSRYQPIFNLL